MATDKKLRRKPKTSFARKYRTVFLAVVATAVLVWGCIYVFEVPISDFTQMLIAALLGIGIIVIAAAIAGYLLAIIRQKL